MADWSSSDQETTPPRQNFFVRWIKRIFRWIRNLFAFVGFVYTVVPLLLIWAFIQTTEGPRHHKISQKQQKDPFSLWLQLDAPIIEHEPFMSESVLRELFGREEGIYLPSVRSGLRDAAADKMVKDLQLSIDGLVGSPADIEELRDVLLDFKTSGKSITAWVTHMDNAALLVASVADKINLNPVSDVSLPGPAFPMTYFGDALKKLGIEMQVVRTGKFKSAFEPFVSNEPSPESREILSAVERSMRDQIVRQVAAGRKKQDSEVFLWFKESFFTPAKAKELGIVDELTYAPSIDFESAPDMLLEDYISDESLAGRLTLGYSLKPNEGLGLIEAVGEIVDSSDGPQVITPAAIEEELRWAMDDDDVRAVVIRIASPGGSAAASDFIWERVRALNEKKPVIISMGSVAASGGYYIASGGQKIFADASTITGSIGVIGMIPNLDGMKDKWGVSFHAITQSNRSNVLAGRKMTAQDQAYLQATIEDVYRTFKSRVAASRKMSMEKVESLAQGRIYTGQQAKENGLVDEIGSLKDAFQFAKKAGGLDENKLYPIHRYEPAQMSLSDCLSSMSKLRKCFRHHGSIVRSEVAQAFFGDEWTDINRLKTLRREALHGSTLMLSPVEAKL
jgi:protease-4